MTLTDLPSLVPNLSEKTHAEKIKIFAWYLTVHEGKRLFKAADISGCYARLSMAEPANVHPYLNSMCGRSPPEALKRAGGFELERRLIERLDKFYGARPATVALDKLLRELPSKIPSVAEQVYLEETLICLQHKAFRAAVVMAWNLAFDHLCEFILRKHLPTFNANLAKTYPRDGQIVTRDDFTEIKESHVIQVVRNTGIASTNVDKILKEKLDRRNVAAHASGVAISQSTAEDCITDLVENVVLKLV